MNEKNYSLRTRTITGIAIAICYLLAYMLGSKFATIFTTIIMLGILYELDRAFKNIELRTYIPILMLTVLISSIYSFIPTGIFNLKIDINVLGLIAIFAAFIFDNSERKIYNLGASAIIYLYVIILGSIFFHYNWFNKYIYLVIIALTTGADVGAYLIGSFFGKHKLMPNISPKKTVEGAVAGVLGGVIMGVLALALIEFETNFRVIMVLFIAAIFSEIGDLFASSIKRAVGIKDFSNLLPGHGGLADRFDSILFTAAVFKVFMTVFLV
ncbi:MAG: phosphatidate cytidylyltransferase [Ezakiella sp.]|nr:phosphatidate cytidylyltransferase [Ezakiella sp.]